ALVVALTLAAIALPVTARVAQAGILLAAPVGLVVLVLWLMRGMSGGVLMLLLSLLDYAYRYTASGIPWVPGGARRRRGDVRGRARRLARRAHGHARRARNGLRRRLRR